MLVTQLVQQRKSNRLPDNKQMRISVCLAFAVFISFSSCIAFLYPVFIKYYNLDHSKADYWHQSFEIKVFGTIAFVLAFTGFGSVLLFYIVRLQTSFDNSVFEISNTVFKCLVICVIIITVWQYFCTINITLISQEVNVWSWAMFTLGFLFWLIEYIVITLLFVRNLFQLVLMQRTSVHNYNNNYNNNSNDNNNNNNNNNNNKNSVRIQSDSLTRRHLILIDTMTKLTILVMSPSVLIIILACLTSINGVNEGRGSILELLWALFVVGTFHELCQSIWLSFFFAEKEYKFWCSWCHKEVKQLCVERAARKLNQQRIRLQSSQSVSPVITPT